MSSGNSNLLFFYVILFPCRAMRYEHLFVQYSILPCCDGYLIILQEVRWNDLDIYPMSALEKALWKI